MQKYLIAALAGSLFVLISVASVPAAPNPCGGNDTVCRQLSALAEAGNFEQIIAQVDPRRAYTAASRNLIGQAYLMVAGREGNTPEQEEQFCLKALEYGASSAYMGLYFIHAGTDPARALGYLRQYVGTKPKDGVPYVLLGEAAFEQQDYAGAKDYLQTARQVSRGRSANVDWLLFQASYLTGDYALASAMLDSSFSQGKTVGDLKALVDADARFSGMAKRDEFRKYLKVLNGTTTAKVSLRS